MIIVPADDTGLTRAAAALRAGELVAFPTETVYGLGGDATNGRAVAAIFAAKARPHFNPLICHVPDLSAAEALVHIDDRARRLAERFWPGALTLVLPRRSDGPVSDLACAGLSTLAVRVPAHPLARALLIRVGRPIAAPSANRSGKISPTSAAHVAASLGDRVALILDGGPCAVGLESTIVELSGPQPNVLRPGGISLDALSAALGQTPHLVAQGSPRAPGMLSSHYAPGLPVRLNATAAAPGEILLAFGPQPAPTGFARVLWLSRRGDLNEAAAQLFAHLHTADDPLYAGIAVAPIPEAGLGLAINDRLRRAAAPRPSREQQESLTP